jgi:hypothetical protein
MLDEPRRLHNLSSGENGIRNGVFQDEFEGD